MDINDTEYVIMEPVPVRGPNGIHARFVGKRNPHHPAQYHALSLNEWGPVKVIQILSSFAMNAYSRLFYQKPIHEDPDCPVLLVHHAKNGVARIKFGTAECELNTGSHKGSFRTEKELACFINNIDGLGAFLAPHFMQAFRNIKGPHSDIIRTLLTRLSADVPEFQAALRASIDKVKDKSIPSGCQSLVPVTSQPLGKPGVVASSEPASRASSSNGPERREGMGIRIITNNGKLTT
jgi:hypothetical protein